MAIDRYTIRISKDIRVVITGILDDATRTLVEAWGRAWIELDFEYRQVIDELIAANRDGKWPNRRTVMRTERVIEALEHTHEQIIKLGELEGVLVSENTRKITDFENDWQERLAMSQLPAAGTATATVAVGFQRLNRDAFDAIVERVAGQVHSYTKPLADDAVDAMKDALVRGVAIGENPRAAAATMLRRVEGRFNGGLTRALTIARTEMLDAHRSAAAAIHFDNTDLLSGWIWNAELDSRTCPSCWAQHGSFHGLDEPGPFDHQQGRCDRLPKVRTWKELGFDLPEPVDLLPDAQTTFWALPQSEQLEIMGPGRLKALQDGDLAWDRLSMRRTSDAWRDSYTPRPLSQI